MFCLCVWMHCKNAWYSQAPTEGTVEFLELELQIVVNHHVGAGKWTQVLCHSEWSLSPVYVNFSAVIRAEEGREEWQFPLLFPETSALPPSLLECSLAINERTTSMSHTHGFMGDITKDSENMSGSENVQPLSLRQIKGERVEQILQSWEGSSLCIKEQDTDFEYLRNK